MLLIVAISCVASPRWQSAIAETHGADLSGEVIHEPYPDGRVKIERAVTTDAGGNRINHGIWRMWDPAGKLVAEGQYEFGRREGAWRRWLNREDARLLIAAPFDQFEAPFISRANFIADRMDGQWTIADARGRNCSRVSLKNGKRSGTATLWLPDGQVLREASFQNGLPDGLLRERSLHGELEVVAAYVGGHQVVNKMTCFPESDVKQVEAACLVAVTQEFVPDDYWALQFAEYSVQATDVRHGTWKSWYSNGQLQCQGEYQNGRNAGRFTWWHANGQQAAMGQLVDGRPDGGWTWWHANGQKASEGQFSLGLATGSWSHWAADGRLVEQQLADNLGNGRRRNSTSRLTTQNSHENAHPAF
jgi:antitoxin component YwqK of YwqJK toxin-antitoxin module